MSRRPKPGSKISSEHRGFNPDPSIQSGFFYGKAVVITGEFADFPERDSLAAILQSHGARVTSAVSSKTDVIIFGKFPGPSKMQKVDELCAAGHTVRYMQLKEALSLLEDLDQMPGI